LGYASNRDRPYNDCKNRSPYPHDDFEIFYSFSLQKHPRSIAICYRSLELPQFDSHPWRHPKRNRRQSPTYLTTSSLLFIRITIYETASVNRMKRTVLEING